MGVGGRETNEARFDGEGNQPRPLDFCFASLFLAFSSVNIVGFAYPGVIYESVPAQTLERKK